MDSQPLSLLKRYRSDLVIAALSVVVTEAFSIIIQLVFRNRDPYLVGLYTFGFFIVFLLVALLLNQKRLIENKFRAVNQVLIDHFGYLSSDNQFFRRRTHYAPEKMLLAKVLVHKVLPRVIREIYSQHPNMTRLHIIIDSGTTLTPVFPELVLSKIPRKENVEVNIYTNSMSGIEEIHKLGYREDMEFKEENINLIGGHPLHKYRATTGETTQDFLKFLWNNPSKEQHIVTLSILTANWFLAGANLKQLSMCARGRGHIEFKGFVSDKTDYRIFVAPLGKILRLDDVKELNHLLESHGESNFYMSYPVTGDEQKRARTYLLTTRRLSNSLSPFKQMTSVLQDIESKNNAENYTFCKESPPFDPPETKVEEVLRYETPHKYIRKNFETAYKIAL
jgi:hypothetical protein